MVTRLLNLSGLYLGSEDDMMPLQAQDNPAGYWENLIFTGLNDDILVALGGSWDHPPEVDPEWWKQPSFDAFRERAAALVADFEEQAPWGWKDPRNCLTLPFWLEVIPDLKVVFCLRHPLEIVWSLSREGETRSFLAKNGLKLWQAYHERFLSAVRPDHFITTHYVSYFYDGQAELQRVLAALEMEVADEIIEQATATIQPDLRHAVYTGRLFPKGELTHRIVQLYGRLCKEGGPVYQQMLEDEAYHLEQLEETVHKQHTLLAAEADRVIRARTEGEALKEANDHLNQSVGRLEDERATLEAEQGTLAESVRRLEREKVALVESVGCVEGEKIALVESVGRLEAEKAAFETERAVLAESVGRLEREKIALVESVGRLEGERVAFETERITLVESVGRLEGEKAAFETERTVLKTERATLETERITLVESVGRLKGEKAALETERRALAESLGRLEGEKVALETGRVVLAESIGRLEGEKTTLAESLGRLESQREALEAERVVLAESIGRLESQREVLEAEKTRLIESLGLLEDERAAHEAERAALKTERAALKTERAALKTEWATLEAKHIAFTESVSRFESQRVDLEAEKTRLIESVGRLEDENTRLAESLRVLEEERASLKAELVALTETADRLEAEQVGFESERERFDESFRRLEHEYVLEQAQRDYLQQERDTLYGSRLLRVLVKVQAMRRIGARRVLKKLRAKTRPASSVRLVVDYPPPHSKVLVSTPLYLAGWTFSEAGPIERIEVYVGETLLGSIDHGVERPDVAVAFPEAAHAACSGYSAFVALKDMPPGDRELIVRATDQAGNSQSVGRPIVLMAPPERASGEPTTVIPDGRAPGRLPGSPRRRRPAGTSARWLAWRVHRIALEPVADEAEADDGTGEAPWHWLRSSQSALPSGRTLFSFQVAKADGPLLPELYAGDHPEAEPSLAHQFQTIPVEHQVQRLVFLPSTVATLKFRPHPQHIEFEIDNFKVYELGRLPLLVVVTVLWLKRQTGHPGRLLSKLGRGLRMLLRQGPGALWLALVQAQIVHQDAVSYPLHDGRAPLSGVGPRRTKEVKEIFTASSMAQLDQFLASGKTLTLAFPEAPVVSIVIILYNRAELTLACLASLVDHAGDDYEVIVVNNASMDRTGALLQQVEGITVLDNDENVGFVTACNQGVEQARGDYILLLNNDAILLPGTLASAVRTLESADDIGVVGARIILLDDTLQEAGCIVWSDGSCAGYGRGDVPNKPMYRYQRDVDFCSGAFLLTRKTVWEALDGFDESFAPAYYEEVDYCLRARHAGWRTVYEPKSVIIHYEFGSSSNAQKAIELQVRNRDTFVAKHAEVLRRQYEPSTDRMLQARSSQRKPRVLVIDDKVPHTYLGSGFPRANFMLHTLIELGYTVTFYPKQFPEEEWHVVYTDLSPEIEVMTGYGNKHLEAFLEARQGFYDIIVVSRPHNMADFAQIVRARPELLADARLIYDAEAVFALREIEEQRLRGRTMKESTVKALIDKELSPAKIADQVMVVSPQEREIFLDKGIASVHLLAHAVELTPTPKRFAERAHFLFVGSLAAEPSPNVDSILWFLDHVFPAVYQDLSARGEPAEFLVVGKNTSPSLAAWRGPGVRFLGVVDDLEPYYNQARVFVAPTRFAAGIPHKIHEASGHGLPVVATQLLADQLKWTNGEDLLSCDASDPEAFIRHCVRLYTDERLWTKLRENALARIDAECSPTQFARVLKEVLSWQRPFDSFNLPLL